MNPINTGIVARSVDEKRAESSESSAKSVRRLYNHIIGRDTKADGDSPMYGLVGKTIPDIDDDRPQTIGIDFDNAQMISVFGAPGGGKSYLLGVLLEMMAMSIPNINVIDEAVTTVIFHFSNSEEYAPEYTAMTKPNDRPHEVGPLRETYRAEPKGLPGQILLAPKKMVERRHQEYPYIPVYPLTFNSTELRADHWRILMGAVGERSMYLQAMNAFMARLRDGISVDALRKEVMASSLSQYDKDQANMRLDLAAQYIDDSSFLRDLVLPGRCIIVDLRDEFLHPDDAFALLQVVLQVVSNTKYKGRKFRKCVVFDEAHQYMGNPNLVAGMIETNRLMRHKRTTVIIASQDPLSVPQPLIEMSTMIFCSKMSAKRWLEYIQEVNTSFDNVIPRHLNDLGRGQAYFWALRSSDYKYTTQATKIQVRTRASLHGGASITAAEEKRLRDIEVAEERRQAAAIGEMVPPASDTVGPPST